MLITEHRTASHFMKTRTLLVFLKTHQIEIDDAAGVHNLLTLQYR